MAAASLRALLANLIDYAGLFPPAALPLEEVVRNYGAYRASRDGWALARLVIPAARLRDVRTMVPETDDPWRLTVLVGEDLGADSALIAAVSEAGHVKVESAEVRATSVSQVRAAVGALWSVPEVYVELPLANNLPTLVKAVADVGARAKIRTGGIVAEAIPSAAGCAQFIDMCARRNVPFKATAGLHHPLRSRYPLTYAPDAPRAEMFGFLNLFIAAGFARGGMRAAELERVLAESDAGAFHIERTRVTWRSHELSLDDLLVTRRTFATTFGSCSFREPIDDLTQLGLLEQ